MKLLIITIKPKIRPYGVLILKATYWDRVAGYSIEYLLPVIKGYINGYKEIQAAA